MLRAEVGQDRDERFWFENVLFLDNELLKVDPQISVNNTVPVQKPRSFNEVAFLLEGYQIDTEFPHELLEHWFLEVFLFELAEVSQEHVKRNPHVFFVESLSEHLLHEEVDFVN
jgi:hypothetical protein